MKGSGIMKDILIRAIKTFIQGFLGSLAVLLSNSDLTDTTFIKSALIGAFSGGISAIMNYVAMMIRGDENNG
jgi:hypothetical protein